MVPCERLLHVTMSYRLRCDSCDFDPEFDDRIDAHERAATHELDHPKHLVAIREPRESA